nr:MAG TPA: hypothetical protein [Caudoviricetes sp.]
MHILHKYSKINGLYNILNRELITFAVTFLESRCR